MSSLAISSSFRDLNLQTLCNTVFAKNFVLVLISDITFIMKFKRLNNCVNENFP